MILLISGKKTYDIVTVKYNIYLKYICINDKNDLIQMHYLTNFMICFCLFQTDYYYYA